jgi:hypothetical protein
MRNYVKRSKADLVNILCFFFWVMLFKALKNYLSDTSKFSIEDDICNRIYCIYLNIYYVNDPFL